MKNVIYLTKKRPYSIFEKVPTSTTRQESHATESQCRSQGPHEMQVRKKRYDDSKRKAHLHIAVRPA